MVGGSSVVVVCDGWARDVVCADWVNPRAVSLPMLGWDWRGNDKAKTPNRKKVGLVRMKMYILYRVCD